MWNDEIQPVPYLHTSLPGPKAKDLLHRDEQYVSPSYTRDYPLVVASGSGCVIEDVDGNRFLDLTAGIAVTAAGHCHPEVVAAIQDQAAKLIHMSGTDFYYAPEIDLAEKLAKLAPGPSTKKVFFTNSGTEAIEAALKLSRFRTGRSRVIAFYGSFHGRTYGSMSLSGSKLVHRRGFSPLVPDVHHVNYPKSCSAPGGDCRAEGKECQMVEGILETLKRTAPPDEVAAIFIEPVQGEGGYHVAPPGCLPALRALCDKHGIMLVLDEVQCGMGRTGKLFAYENWGIEPDIVCIAKGIASGMPLGAIVAKTDVMTWPRGSHASTFGGNPVSCRAALATINLLQREYLANTRERGKQMHEGLVKLQNRRGFIANARGLGLMRAVDVINPATGKPDADLRNRIVDQAYYKGLLLLGCGEHGIRFCPSLCITAKQVDKAIELLESVLVEQESARLALV